MGPDTAKMESRFREYVAAYLDLSLQLLAFKLLDGPLTEDHVLVIQRISRMAKRLQMMLKHNPKLIKVWEEFDGGGHLTG